MPNIVIFSTKFFFMNGSLYELLSHDVSRIGVILLKRKEDIFFLGTNADNVSNLTCFFLLIFRKFYFELNTYSMNGSITFYNSRLLSKTLHSFKKEHTLILLLHFFLLFNNSHIVSKCKIVKNHYLHS